SKGASSLVRRLRRRQANEDPSIPTGAPVPAPPPRPSAPAGSALFSRQTGRTLPPCTTSSPARASAAPARPAFLQPPGGRGRVEVAPFGTRRISAVAPPCYAGGAAAGASAAFFASRSALSRASSCR